MRIKAKRMILIIVVCIVVYLVAGAMGPFIKYKDVSSQTAEEFLSLIHISEPTRH